MDDSNKNIVLMAARFKHNIAAINFLTSQRAANTAALKTYEIQDASCRSEAGDISITCLSSDAQWQCMSTT
jgi:hypothetical protein